MELEVFVKELFALAKSEGFEEYEVYYVDKESLSINIYKEEVEKYNLTNSYGLSFRAKINGKMGYSYTEILDKDAIKMLVLKVKESALSIENDDIQFIYDGDENYAEIQSYYKELENLPADKLIELALSMEKECKNYTDKISSFGGCGIGYTNANYGLINSKGLNLNNKSNLLSAYVVPIIKSGEDMYDGMGYVMAKSIGEVDTKKIAKQGVDEALARIGGKSIASGKYKAVIYNEAMVSLLSNFAGIFSADAVQKGLSLLKDKEGEIIAAPIVTLVDDPLLKDGLATVAFDDEGVATSKKSLISKGKLETLLHNLKTAHKAGCKTTGNGFKSSYASPVSISPTNLYIEKGEKTYEELLEEVKDGIVITELSGLHAGANAVTGEFSLAAKGFMIENGKRTFPIEQITIADNFFNLLKNIKVIGNDLKFPMSSVGSPSVIINEIAVAGK